jgi:glycosyltransferase involved in cell wall biosynthesis
MARTILHISTRLILGGSQENTVLSCEGQARIGHEVHLAFGPIYGPEGSLLERAETFRTDDGRSIGCHELPNLVREIHPVKDHFCFHHDLKRLIDELKPDIVHTHSSKAGILGRWAAWVAMKRLGKPIGVVHTIHGPPFMPVEGSVVSRTKTRVKNHVYTLAERFAARRCHTIVSVADAMTEQFLARGIGKPEQYITVRSGMETERFLEAAPGESRASMRAELGFGDGDFVIGTVARLAQHKGHDDMLDALGEDLRANPNRKLLWVGDGWWTDRLMARVRAMGLEKQVVHTGLVPQHRVGAMMRAMDLLVHPSYREGLPRTVPQALLCGVPVCASDTDGTPEVITETRIDPDEGTGCLFPVGDTGALGESVRWMIEHGDERRASAERGRARCAAWFSTTTMVDALEAVYGEALERARR